MPQASVLIVFLFLIIVLLLHTLHADVTVYDRGLHCYFQCKIGYGNSVVVGSFKE